jgi:hypothetical protein
MTIEAYLEAIKERLATDPMVTRFHVIRERSTLIDGHLRARLTLVDGPYAYSLVGLAGIGGLVYGLYSFFHSPATAGRHPVSPSQRRRPL